MRKDSEKLRKSGLGRSEHTALPYVIMQLGVASILKLPQITGKDRLGVWGVCSGPLFYGKLIQLENERYVLLEGLFKQIYFAEKP